jgi:hypothetical protein
MGNAYSPLPLSHSLTVVNAAPRSEGHAASVLGGIRFRATESGFVAHLLAVKHGVPEFRHRRTSSPDAAGMAYTTRSKPVGIVKNRISIAA